MIRIRNSKLTSIATDHFIKTAKQINLILDFYEKAFDLFEGKGVTTDDLIAFVGIKLPTKTALLRLFVSAKDDFKGQDDYHMLSDLNKLKTHYQGSIAYYRSLITVLKVPANQQALLIGEPKDLLATHKRLKLVGWTANETKAFVNKIIDYDAFCSKTAYPHNAYRLAELLKVEVCPYCNRSYTSTIVTKNGKKVCRPTLDHFFDKATYPLLALSFYNLIPSCSLCNSYLKGKIEFKLKMHLHPYLDEYGDDFTFNYDSLNYNGDKSDPRNYKVTIDTNIVSTNPKYKMVKGDGSVKHGSMKVFKTDEIYTAHANIVGELVVKCDEQSSYYAESLKIFFDNMGSSKTEFYRYYFGNYFNENDFNLRPLAKLTKDIVCKLRPEFKDLI